MRALAIIAVLLMVLLLFSGCTEALEDIMKGLKEVAESLAFWKNCGDSACTEEEQQIVEGRMLCPRDCGTCIDSDGGVDLYTDGSVQDADMQLKDPPETAYDMCWERFDERGRKTAYIVEGVCYRNTAYAVKFKCPTGKCKNDYSCEEPEYEWDRERVLTENDFCLYHDPDYDPLLDPESNVILKLTEKGKEGEVGADRICDPREGHENDLVVCRQHNGGAEFDLVTPCKYGCNPETLECYDPLTTCMGCGVTGVKYCADDTTCTSAWDTSECWDVEKTDEGESVYFNHNMPSCGLFEVCSPELDYIIDAAKECCISETPYGSACHFAHANGGEDDIKQCLGLYIIKSVANGAYMGGYFSQELCCASSDSCPNSFHGKCDSPSPAINQYTSALPCPGYKGIWNCDTDMSKNSCWKYDLPAHVSLNVLKTGTCVDYSVAVTTLLRKAGYLRDEVMSIASQTHAYNLVKLPGYEKYHFVDTTGANGVGIVPKKLPRVPTFASDTDYCYDTDWGTAANDTGYVTAPPRSEIFGC